MANLITKSFLNKTKIPHLKRVDVLPKNVSAKKKDILYISIIIFINIILMINIIIFIITSIIIILINIIFLLLLFIIVSIITNNNVINIITTF